MLFSDGKLLKKWQRASRRQCCRRRKANKSKRWSHHCAALNFLCDAGEFLRGVVIGQQWPDNLIINFFCRPANYTRFALMAIKRNRDTFSLVRMSVVVEALDVFLIISIFNSILIITDRHYLIKAMTVLNYNKRRRQQRWRSGKEFH